MAFGLKDKDIIRIQGVIRNCKAVSEAILYGSRAVNAFHNGSDIDLALKGKDIGLDDMLQMKIELDELPLPYEFDVVLYDSITSAGLKKQIDEHGKVFYQSHARREELAREGKK